MSNELNSGISNYSAVYQTVMEELVGAVQRNELTLTLKHKPRNHNLQPRFQVSLLTLYKARIESWEGCTVAPLLSSGNLSTRLFCDGDGDRK